MRFQRSILTTFATLLLAASFAWAEEPMQRLRSPAIAHGFIGGESHAGYVIHARKGQVMTVQLSWKSEHDPDQAENHGYNSAGFWIRELQNFDANAQATFGKASKNAQRWFGTIPKTGDYHVYVTAHPTADYTLRITIK